MSTLTATDSNETPSSSNLCSDVLSAKRYARVDGDTYQTSFSEEGNVWRFGSKYLC